MKKETSTYIAFVVFGLVAALTLYYVAHQSWTNKDIPMLDFHRVADCNQTEECEAEFDAYLGCLNSSGYDVISLAQLERHITKGAVLPPNPIVLTFDDGFKDAYATAYPLLKKYGYTATFFVITTHAEEATPGYLSWQEIEEMAASGQDIELHANIGHTNRSIIGPNVTRGTFFGNRRYLENYSRWETDKEYKNRAKDDLATSIRLIREHTGRAPHYWAYPYGDYGQFTDPSRPVERLLREAMTEEKITMGLLVDKEMPINATDLYRMGRLKPDWHESGCDLPWQGK